MLDRSDQDAVQGGGQDGVADRRPPPPDLGHGSVSAALGMGPLDGQEVGGSCHVTYHRSGSFDWPPELVIKQSRDSNRYHLAGVNLGS